MIRLNQVVFSRSLSAGGGAMDRDACHQNQRLGVRIRGQTKDIKLVVFLLSLAFNVQQERYRQTSKVVV